MVCLWGMKTVDECHVPLLEGLSLKTNSMANQETGVGDEVFWKARSAEKL